MVAVMISCKMQYKKFQKCVQYLILFSNFYILKFFSSPDPRLPDYGLHLS